MINELAESWQIKGVNSPLLLGKSVYDALVKLRNYALVLSEPPSERGEQVQLVLNRLVTIAAIHQRRRKTPKMRFQRIALNLFLRQSNLHHVYPPFPGFRARTIGRLCRTKFQCEAENSAPNGRMRGVVGWYRHNRAVGMQTATIKARAQVHHTKHLHTVG